MNYKTVYKAVLIFSLFVAIVAGVFMSAGLLSSSDTMGLNAYDADNVEYYAPVIWLFIISVAGYVAAATVFSKRIGKRMDFDTFKSRLGYSTLGFSLIALFVFCIGREFFVKGEQSHGDMYVLYKEVRVVETGMSTTEFSYLYLAFLVALVAAAAFLIYGAFKKGLDYDGSATGSELFAGLSMLPSAALAFKIIYDFLLQSNNGYGALYNFHLLGIGFTLLFSVYETRFYFKKAMPALYLFFGLTAATASLIFSIPALALFFAGKAGANWHPAFCVADIIIVAYIYVRLFSLNVRQYERQKKSAAFAPAFEPEGDLTDSAEKVE